MSNTKRATRPTPLPRKGTSQATKIAIAVIALLCVAAVIAIPILLNGGDDDSSAQVSSHPNPTSVDDVSCDKPPATPSNPKQFSTPPPASLAENTTWNATLHTTCGDITVQLDGKAAPQTVASFIHLAREGYWNDGPCHRVTTEESSIHVLQCGDPTGTGSGSPGYGFGIENAPASGHYPRGTLAMARSSDPNSNGGQFFLVYKDTQLPTQDGGYSIFGKVTGGLQIVDAIAKQGTDGANGDGAPSQPISILSVDVEKANS
ncbi:MAG TPA: peptidylprolyl isomerase [Nocardioidaceae bacterium]|jgi:peptidyl-prolyl cis-trans isomerase B (cyclophilin B)